MERLKAIADDATNGINSVLNSHLSDEQANEIRDIIEAAVIQAVLEGQHRAVDAALQCPEEEQDKAHKIASEIRRKNDLLIANMSSLR